MIDLNHTVEPYEYASIPEGIYIAAIDEILEKKSQAGHSYLSFKFRIADGPYKNRYLFENINLFHPNEKVKKIARNILNGIGYALNFTKIGNAMELLNKPMQVRIRLDKDGKNNIVRYFKMSETPSQVLGKNQTQIDHSVREVPEPPPKTPNAVPPLDVNDDDIPF